MHVKPKFWAFALCIFLFSCEKPTVHEVHPIPTETAYTGSDHTAGMQAYFAFMQKAFQNRSGEIDRAWFVTTSQQALEAFVKEHPLTAHCAESLAGNIQQEDFVFFDYTLNRTPAKRSSMQQLLEDERLSVEQKNYLSELDEVLGNVTESNYKSVIQDLSVLLEEARKHLSEQDLELVRIGVVTGISSVAYAVENFETWLNTFRTEDEETWTRMKRGGPDYAEIGRADVTGAVSGALSGAVVGGVGAGPGAVLGGVGASSGELIWQAGNALGQYFGWWD